MKAVRADSNALSAKQIGDAFMLLLPDPRSTVAAVLVALGLTLLANACAEDVPPAYVRLGGVAPRFVDAPPPPAVLLSFWATWCPPCLREAPALEALAADPPAGLAVVVLSQDESMDAVLPFFANRPHARLDLRIDGDRAIAHSYGVETLPVSILVVEGRLAARFDGPRDWNSRGMRRLLGKLIASAAREN